MTTTITQNTHAAAVGPNASAPVKQPGNPRRRMARPARESKEPATRAPEQRKPEPVPSHPRAPSKLDGLSALLLRTEGANLAEMMAVTGWQAHSVRRHGRCAQRARPHHRLGQSRGCPTLARGPRGPRRMSRTPPKPSAQADLTTLPDLDLQALRAVWERHWGDPPPLRSVVLLRLLIAWRLQAAPHGGLDRDTKRALARQGSGEVEGLHLGIGARLTRVWQGRAVEVLVEEQVFVWQGQRYPSLSAAATAIAGSRWNGPRFFGLRSNGEALAKPPRLKARSASA